MALIEVYGDQRSCLASELTTAVLWVETLNMCAGAIANMDDDVKQGETVIYK